MYRHEYMHRTAVASTGEYLAGHQHRHDRLAAASSDAAAAEISNVLPTPKTRVGSWSLAAASAEWFKLSWAWVRDRNGYYKTTTNRGKRGL